MKKKHEKAIKICKSKPKIKKVHILSQFECDKRSEDNYIERILKSPTKGNLPLKIGKLTP